MTGRRGLPVYGRWTVAFLALFIILMIVWAVR